MLHTFIRRHFLILRVGGCAPDSCCFLVGRELECSVALDSLTPKAEAAFDAESNRRGGSQSRRRRRARRRIPQRKRLRHAGMSKTTFACPIGVLVRSPDSPGRAQFLARRACPSVACQSVIRGYFRSPCVVPISPRDNSRPGQDRESLRPARSGPPGLPYREP